MGDEQMRRAARARALRMLSRREHASRELVCKLRERGYAPPMVEALVAELAQEGWVSDARYAAALVQDRCSRGYGPLRIRAELRHRGVDEALADSQLQWSDAEWSRLAQQWCAKRFGEPSAVSRKERERRFRWLLNRGFTREQIRKSFQGKGARMPVRAPVE